MSKQVLGATVLAGAMLVGCGPDALPPAQIVQGVGREAELRAADRALSDAFVKRDYAAAWEYLDSSSRDAIEKQLDSFRSVPPNSLQEQVSSRALTELGLRLSELSGMDARDYFIATLESLDRVQPELRRLQTERTRTREIAGITFDGDRATVRMRVPGGEDESYEWVLEGGEWKSVATSVGKGVEVDSEVKSRVR